MSSCQEKTQSESNPQIQGSSGSPEAKKEPTLATTYPIASQSTLNIDRNDDDSNIELRATTDELSETIQQSWISYTSEWWMVGCFAVMALMVSLDAVILMPILPVSLLLRIDFAFLHACNFATFDEFML